MRSFAAFRDVRLHAVVEFLGRIVSHLFLTVIDRRRLYDDCQVTSRTDRNVVADHFISKEFRVLVFKTEAVIFLILIPLFEFDNHVDGLGVLDALDAKQGLYIDDADPAHLDQVSCDIRGRADKCLVADLADLHHIVV